MRLLKYILNLILTIAIVNEAVAQNRNKLVMVHDHLILLLDSRADNKTIDSLLKSAGLVGINAQMVKQGNFVAAIKDGWSVSGRKNNIIEFNRSVPLRKSPPASAYLITTQTLKTNFRPGYPSEVLYGLNDFSKVTVRELPNGMTRFFFPLHIDNRRVLLSGNFNDWSTVKGLMIRTDTGWIKDIKLEPGKYAYKFIADGNWMTDPFNLLTENDGENNYNSIYYKYNYTFKLSGYNHAHKVTVAGTFNKWNSTEIPLKRHGSNWETQLYLHEGIFLYRFMIDGQWVSDPGNSSVENGDNTTSSVLKFGTAVNFSLAGYPKANKVFVSGDFTNWNSQLLSLKKSSGGWNLPYTLAAGNYLYNYVIDGKLITDPGNPHRINIDGNFRSFLSVKPNYTFRLKGYGNAHSIVLSGSFNNWNESGYTMKHQGNEWVISMNLKPGKYLYKFIIDGNWIIDPDNKLWEQNEFGTGNSVLWMD